MDDSLLRKFIIRAVQEMEGALANPYSASFAVAGTSALSFGTMQLDVGNDPYAYALFSQIMNADQSAAGLSNAEVAAILQLASRHGVIAAAFTPRQLAAIDQSLQDQSALVDAGDQHTADIVVDDVLSVMDDDAAVNTGGLGELNKNAPNPFFLAELGEWGNQSGGLDRAATGHEMKSRRSPSITAAAEL
jgi:hypothetical protein